jgi:SAM-dependent methyltransferase
VDCLQLHRAKPPARRDVLLGLSTVARVPPYFDGLIAGFNVGRVGRFVHLGAWDEAPSPEKLAEPGAFERAQARLHDRLLELAALADGQKVMDAGCGFGGTLEVIDAHFRGMALFGINIDSRQLAICRSLPPRETNILHWAHADACALPFADASIDRLLCFEAMFHFDSRRNFVREAARVLAPGGVMVASDIVLRRAGVFAGEADSAMLDTVLRGFGPWPDFWGDDADPHALAAAAGLTCTACVDVADATLPSHVFTVRPDASARDPIARAAAALAALHRAGRLSYLLMRFEHSSARHAARNA